jgi:hypothetical protein
MTLLWAVKAAMGIAAFDFIHMFRRDYSLAAMMSWISRMRPS